MIEPMTMPAIAPPLSPFFRPPCEAPAELVGVDVALAVDVNRSAIDEKTGSLTFWHRPCALDVKQQESVAFSVLERQ